jgi:hypothetical protein
VRRCFALVLVAVLSIWTADSCHAVGPVGVRLQPHLAIYDLVLKRSVDRLGLTGVNGRLAIEVSGSECQHWTVNFRMVSQFQNEDESQRLLDTRSLTEEAGNGKSLDVEQQNYVDGSLDSESKITAAKKPDGSVQGTILKPQEQPFQLTAGTVFPVGHLQRLIETAERGEKRDKSIVFDGTEGTKVYTAITLLGGEREKGSQRTALQAPVGAELKKVKAWPATISYYDLAKGDNNDGTPSFEILVEMFENGVSGDMVIDYGDYALNAKLAELKLKPYGACK